MPAHKDFKRLVRGRMQKTGESYTAARSHLLKLKPAAVVKPTAPDYAKLAGTSDATIKAKTGWWTQSVTVGYERIKGLRAIGQRRDGSFEANKSKTFVVPVGRLYGAFRNARTRARWLPGVKLSIRTATPDKSMRITWSDGTSLVVGFARRGVGKSQVAIQHEKLPDKAAATRMKEYWAERLGALEKVITAPAAAAARARPDRR